MHNSSDNESKINIKCWRNNGSTITIQYGSPSSFNEMMTTIQDNQKPNRY